MAKRFTIEMIMNLAKAIGANPNKFMGTKTNITFLGKGPTKNPLFQNRLAGLENASVQNLGKPETLFAAIDDAVGWAKDGKLNSIQTEILGHNLSGINKIINPPPLPTLPMASVTPIRSGIRTLRSNDIGAGPRRYNELTGLNKPRVVDDRGRTWDFKSRLPEPGPEAFNKALNQKTGMSRAIARELLLQDTRLTLKPEELFMLKEGKGEPLDLMRKYYGNSMVNLDAFMDNVAFRGFTSADEAAATALKEIELIPQFAQGGLARILEV